MIEANERVYFYCLPQGPPDRAAFQHDIVSLAEGLSALGVEFHANCNYWKISSDADGYLLSYDASVHPEDCSIVVVSHAFADEYGCPPNLRVGQRKATTVCMSFGAWSSNAWRGKFRQFDLVLRSHFNRRCASPANFRPWAFGLSSRILRCTENHGHVGSRRPCLLWNPRCEHLLRRVIAKQFLPLIRDVLPLDESREDMNEVPDEPWHRMMWEQTGRRHHPRYYQRLRESVACACFGGSVPSDWWETVGRCNIVCWLHDLMLRSPKPVVAWDSWRFWEALAAGCVPFHFDFDKYGMQLPVMPENFVHYVGVDLDNPFSAVRRLQANPKLLEQIATAGQQWSLKNYNPKAIAARFLETVDASRR